MWNLATLVLFSSCVSLAVGWLATSHVVYRVLDDSPFAFMAPALVAMDRMLLGQIAVLGSFVRKLVYARELLVGLGGLRTEGEAEAPAAAPIPGAAASFAWVRRGLGMLDTARRVQARMAGHVAREIAGDAIREQTPTPTPQTRTRTPSSPLPRAPGRFAAQPLRGPLPSEIPPPAPQTPWSFVDPTRHTPTPAPSIPHVRVAAPWETDDEDGEAEPEARGAAEREASGVAAGGTIAETTGEASGVAAGATMAETTGEASGAAGGGNSFAPSALGVPSNSFAPSALGVPSTMAETTGEASGAAAGGTIAETTGEASGAAAGGTIAETPAGVTGVETARSVDMLFAEINAC